MGRPCARRSTAFRVPDFGRSTGWTELEHYFEETGELSKSVQSIRGGKGRPLWQARCAAAAAKRWHRAQPFENRSDNREREKIYRGARKIRNVRRLSLELRWRQANPESLAKID